MDSLPESYLPDSFAVDTDYRNPATNQAQRGTCWAWSTLYILETQYRQQGISQGFLNPDEYVKFSVQAFVSKLWNYCIEHQNSKVCQYGGFLQNTSDDNQVEALPYFLREIPDLNVSIVPDAVCPYINTPSPDTDFKCDDLPTALKSNPIRFTFKGMTTVFDVRAAKQLLLTKQRPLGIGTPLGTVNYVVSCSDPTYESLPQCVNKSFLCPNTQDSSYCAVLAFEGRLSDGTFISIDTPTRQSSYGGHAMNVVGYNDNWRYDNRIASSHSVESSKGCLILHNSWMANGHSIEYLMGRRTLENELTSCPNMRAPQNWIPATAECAIENYTDVRKCSTDIKRIRGHGLTNGADVLNCTNTNPLYCKLNHSYVLKRKEDSEDVDVYELENGLHSIGVITWGDGEEPHEERLETLPFWALDRSMKPYVDLVENNDQECGFYALPYSAIDNVRKRQWDLFDNFKVSDFDIEFEASSYERSPASKSYNTTYLNLSTYHQSDAQFDGPIPFNLIY